MEGGQWRRIGQTETVSNNLNPIFKKKISIEYQFQKLQRLKFTVYDDDGMRDAECIGSLEISLGKLLAQREQQKVLEGTLKDPKKDKDVGKL